MYAMMAYITLVFIIIVAFAISLLVESSLNKNIKSLEAYKSSTDVSLKIKATNIKKKKIEIMNEYLSSVDKIQAAINRKVFINSDLLKSINTTIPGDILIDNISLTEGNISLQGKAGNTTSPAELAHNLYSLGIFSDVSLNSVQKYGSESGIFGFNITCIMKVGENK